MNERIKELAKLATQQYSPTYYTQEWIQGFAELIIQECAHIMDGRDENGNAKDGQHLLTKFGIDASKRYI